jgi:two-component system sensor histidine kinase HydH
VRQEHAELRHAEQRRLAALGEMSAVLAHEIRNPLASLKGHAQLLAEGLQDGSAQRRSADRVVSEAKRLERLASSLLDFVRTSQVELETVDPAELARECAAEAGAGRVDVEDAGAPPAWRLDALRMRQVLRNLVENALQASPPEARVTVRVALAQGDSRGERLVYEVRDVGEGISAAVQERLFDPFHTTRTTGTGLGLAVARRIVELHGGTITGANDPAGGAVFRVFLPFVPEP